MMTPARRASRRKCRHKEAADPRVRDHGCIAGAEQIAQRHADDQHGADQKPNALARQETCSHRLRRAQCECRPIAAIISERLISRHSERTTAALRDGEKQARAQRPSTTGSGPTIGTSFSGMVKADAIATCERSHHAGNERCGRGDPRHAAERSGQSRHAYCNSDNDG